MKASDFVVKYPELIFDSRLASYPEWNEKDMFEHRCKLTLNGKSVLIDYWMGKGYVEYENHKRLGYKPVLPKLDDVLVSLAEECFHFEENPGIVNFFAEWGVTKISLEDMETYRLVEKNYHKLKNLFPCQMWKDFTNIREDD